MPVTIAPDRITLHSASGLASTTVLLHGATLISWTYSGVERLFTSTHAVTDGSKAVRGGIPLVFPQFGPVGVLPQHGFARTSKWAFGGVHTDSASSVSCSFVLTHNQVAPEMRKLWPFEFQLVYTVTLAGNNLVTGLKVSNTGTAAFDFTTLFHTYIRVKQIAETHIVGLEGVAYTDSVLKKSVDAPLEPHVDFSGEVDRVYPDVGYAVAVAGVMVLTRSANLPDVVVWNPWVDKARGMSDFGDEEYREMVCVEAGKVASPVSLSAGTSADFSQVLTVW